MIYAKVRPVVRLCCMIISLLLISVIFGNQRMLAQCPEIVRIDNNSVGDSGSRTLLVFDGSERSLNVSGYEINIFNESSGNYLITESNIVPSIGIAETIGVSKTVNRIVFSDLNTGIDLTKCLIILVGNDCPIKKIRIKDN